MICKATLNKNEYKLRSFTMKDYRELLKLLVGVSDNEQNQEISIMLYDFLVEYMYPQVISQLDLYDLAVLVLTLRGMYFGDEIRLKIGLLSFSVNTFQIIEKIQNIQRTIDYSLLNRNYEICYGAPSCHFLFNMSADELRFLEQEVTDHSLIDIAPLFWKEAKIPEGSIRWHHCHSNYSYSSIMTGADEIYKKLAPTFLHEEKDLMTNWHNATISNNLLPDHEGIGKFLYFPLPSVFASLVKMCFPENLETVYENMFHLAKTANISCEYIDSCEPGEYFLYVSMLQKLIVQQNVVQQSPQQ